MAELSTLSGFIRYQFSFGVIKLEAVNVSGWATSDTYEALMNRPLFAIFYANYASTSGEQCTFTAGDKTITLARPTGVTAGNNRNGTLLVFGI